MQRVWAVTPVIIVSYRTAADVAACLMSLDAMQAEPLFSVHICENGGAGAFNDLCEALLQSDGPCAPAENNDSSSFEGSFNRVRCFCLRRSNRRVLVGEARANLGYAGGINTWLVPLLGFEGWPALWILNPDTAAAPDALSALAGHATYRQLDMVGSRIVESTTAAHVNNYGLRWRRWMGAAYAVGQGQLASIEPDADAVEAEIDSANGASLYVTRSCAKALAPLDEKYFLYFEDLDWGTRARAAGFRIGYAHQSIITHYGGSSIGSPSRESVGSPFSIYLEFRSSLQFTRTHHPGYLPWTALIRCVQALRLWPRGRFRPAMLGLIAGLRGETGYPRTRLQRAPEPQQADGVARQTPARIVKATVSMVWLVALRLSRLIPGRRAGAPFAILYYHAVRPEHVSMFRWQLSTIEAYGDVVPADYAGGSDGRPKIALTFDDAFQSVFDFAVPEMVKRNMPSTIFVPTACIGAAPTWEMEYNCFDRNEILACEETLRAAARDGIQLGAHARTHPRLTAIAPDGAREEIAGSKADLERLLGSPVDTFSFPYGDFNERTVQYCKEAGYRYAYSITPALVDLSDGAMLRPRIAVDPSDTKLEFWLKLRGAYSWMRLASLAKNQLRGRR